MNHLVLTPSHRAVLARRVGWALLAAFWAAFAGLEVVNHGAPALVAAVGFFFIPDLTLLIGAGSARELQRGQLPPRAVPAYNLMHSAWLPLAVLVIYAVTPLEWVLIFAAGLGWLTHISVDRALGLGLRTRDGFQRG